MNSTNSSIRWRYGFYAALAVTIVSLYPQVRFWLEHEQPSSSPPYVVVQGDEPLYATYINALINGRTRRNNPLTGVDEQTTGERLDESYFSIQFFPAYLIALPARFFGADASQAFIALRLISAFLTSLALFWMLAMVTRNDELACVGAICVLCFGTAAGGDGALRLLIGFREWQGHFVNHLIDLPFLRRYQPGATFPLFFLFCTLVWRAFVDSDNKHPEPRPCSLKNALLAGDVFVLIVFSYFYLWTTAAAWLFIFSLLWLLARPAEWRRLARNLVPLIALALAALIPYFRMLSARIKTTDSVMLLEKSHAPDLFRIPEIIAFLLLLLIAFAVLRRQIDWRSPQVIFVVSTAFTPFVVFNQQIFTGQTLQPIHYEEFITNYLVLAAVVMAIPLLKLSPIPAHYLRIIALLAIGWGFIEVAATRQAVKAYNAEREIAFQFAEKIDRLSSQSGPDTSSPLVFSPSALMNDNLTSAGSSVAILWGTYMPNLPGITPKERRERAFQYLYFSDTTAEELRSALQATNFDEVNALFGVERAIPVLTVRPVELTHEEIENAVRDYSAFIKDFNGEQAARYPFSFIVTRNEQKKLMRLNRWYEQKDEQTCGAFTLASVKLRPQAADDGVLAVTKEAH